MSDRNPVIIAIAVGGLALAANGAAAAIAISASPSPPEAIVFGIAGLTAAFIGLIAALIWAFRDESKPSLRRERVFTPWAERADATELAPLTGSVGRSPLALARSTAPAPFHAQAPATAAAVGEGRVIYIAEWLKAHDVQHA